MKKYFLLLFFIFPVIVNAQRFRAGLFAGFVASDLNGSDAIDIDNDFSKAGFTAGGLLNTKLSEKNSLQFEIAYTTKGTLQKHRRAGDTTGGPNPDYYKLNLDYVEVPLLFKHKFQFNMKKKTITNFYWEFGPSYGRLVRVYQEGSYAYATMYANNFKPDELAINIGMGCRIFNNLSFNVRYSNSIIPVVYHNVPTSSTFFWNTFNKGDNMVWAFTFRYVFSKEKEKNIQKETDDSEN